MRVVQKRNEAVVMLPYVLITIWHFCHWRFQKEIFSNLIWTLWLLPLLWDTGTNTCFIM